MPRVFHQTLTFANNNFDKPIKVLRIEGFSLDWLFDLYIRSADVDLLMEFLKYIINTLMSL